jgi:RNA polymerase sigma factor (sigma-70 family)
MHHKGELWATANKLSEEQQKLVTDNLPLAYHYCKKRPIPGLDRDENESEALFCLTRAAANFDPALGYKFSTFAWSVWINHRKDAHRQSQMETKGYLTAQTAYHDDKAKMFDPQDKQPGPDEIAEKKDELEDKLKRFSVLDLRAKEVLQKRMEGKTLFEIGQELGITRERVRQIEKSAIYRIQYLTGSEIDTTNPLINEHHEIQERRNEASKEHQRKVAAIQAIRRQFPRYGSEKIAKQVGCSVKLARKYMVIKKHKKKVA